MKILVAAGASGGHIFPALAFLEKALEDPQHRALLILPKNCRVNNISSEGFKIEYVALPGKNIINSFKGVLSCLGLVLKFHPDVVVGFGTIVSFPVVILGWFLRAKTIIHEQNVLPGKANKVLAYFVDKVAVSFSRSRAYFKNNTGKVVFTGNPLRKALFRMDKDSALRSFGFSPDKYTVLVSGGSQGSHKINAEFLACAGSLKKWPVLQVIHLCGQKDLALLKKGYADLNIPAAVYSFYEPMQIAYSASDLIVGRAGATSMAEIIYFQLPAILVPYPHASAHQSANAEVLSETGCGVVIKDENLTAMSLGRALEEHLDGVVLGEKRKKFSQFEKVDAAELLVKEAFN